MPPHTLRIKPAFEPYIADSGAGPNHSSALIRIELFSKMATTIHSLPPEILCEIASYLHPDEKDYVFYKCPSDKWTLYIEGAPLSMILNPITSCQTVLLVKSVTASITRTHPCSWAVLQPRINDPEPLEILDKVGKLPAKRRAGKIWVKEVGDNGWGMVWSDDIRNEVGV